ncbi:relaxase/mobilization nuclease domain-containing protein [Shimia marina]|uniref:Type IV secretion system T-DNA border endonuclease VirD2 n=1 Tax=Shimia marina TaxID=321267 RepID=A0A0P1ER32_9RHOB|nr:relaxase/mobilization nuclease domain-containing protein [Shimia marina]CUH52693.1 type IV secretion system T-DNA border endonuclease VirD2 [Shimia marina]SFE75528.1 type IV secretion system T-DNA border endonuclease VirD2 [Shimia marina]
MARNSAVAAAQEAFFDRDWSRIRGSVPRARTKQMARAAMGHSPAIFKAIRDGGTHTKAQLRNQLNYLTTKSSFIIDSRGTYDGQRILSAKEAEQVTRRFSAQWNEGFYPKLGHTSHLLMAFPIGTRGVDVAEITREVCERLFQGEGSHFDYIAAVHEDRDHPHAHIVLNRRSKDGEFFFFKKGHHFNYDRFREAMVEVSDRFGLRLEATRKRERGITTNRPSDIDQRRAEATGHKLTERERVGPELDNALREVAQNARLYRGLAAEASRENQYDIAAALDKAARLLAQGKPIEADGKVYGMAEEQHSFDEVVDAFHGKIEQAEKVVADAPPERRAALEQELNEIYRSISHLSPIGVRSNTLLETPSDSGIYSAENIADQVQDKLRSDAVADRLQLALKDTGISRQEVVSRIEIGAQNAALERQWLSRDLVAIAETEGLDLSKRDDLEKAVDRLDELHGELGRVLNEAAILRDAGATEVVENDRAPVENLPPVASDALQHLQQDPASDPFRDNLERDTLRRELNELVGDDRAADLAIGDESALEDHLEDRLDRLYVAKAYLQSEPELANSVAMEHVLNEIASEEIEVQRQQHTEIDGEKGVTHG